MVRHDQDTSTGDEGCMGIFGTMEKCQWYFFYYGSTSGTTEKFNPNL